MRIDLHLHSSCSDGRYAPGEVVAAARRAGLAVIALTDHDTAAGVAPAQAATAALAGPRVIAGIELSCTLDGADLHLLGYGIDPGDAGLRALTDDIGRRRQERVGEIIARLNALGVVIALEDVRPPTGNAAVGRPHIAQALLRLGRISTFQEAFTNWLADGGPAYVPAGNLQVEEGIRAVAAAGGLAVWAHPAPEDMAKFGGLAARGLHGVEVYRPSVSPAQSVALARAAAGCGLLVTGGSDWHGARPDLGAFHVTELLVGAFLDRLGSAAT